MQACGKLPTRWRRTFNIDSTYLPPHGLVWELGLHYLAICCSAQDTCQDVNVQVDDRHIETIHTRCILTVRLDAWSVSAPTESGRTAAKVKGTKDARLSNLVQFCSTIVCSVLLLHLCLKVDPPAFQCSNLRWPPSSRYVMVADV